MKQDFLQNTVAIVVCMFFIMIQARNRSKYIRAVQIQNFLWLFGFLIYLLGIMQYYPLNDTVYFSAILYLAAFNCACLLNPVSIKGKKIKSLDVEEYQDTNRTRKCVFASIICWAASIPILQKSITILFAYGSLDGMNALRYRTYGEYSIFSTPEMLLMTYIIRPVMVVTIIFMAEEIAQRRIDLKLIIVALLDAFWLILATAGRSLLVSLVIYIVLAVISINGANVIIIIKKYKKYIIPAIVLMVIIVEIISKRVNRDSGLIEEGIIYFFSGLPYFSTMIEQGIAEPYVLLGKGTFSFIIDLPILILRFFGVTILSGSQYLSSVSNSVLAIGNGMSTNATSSTLFAFYSDFGLLGSIIGGLLLGRIAFNVEYQFNKTFNALTFGRYLFVLAMIISTTQIYPLSGITFTMTWMFLYILLK